MKDLINQSGETTMKFHTTCSPRTKGFYVFLCLPSRQATRSISCLTQLSVIASLLISRSVLALKNEGCYASDDEGANHDDEPRHDQDQQHWECDDKQDQENHRQKEIGDVMHGLVTSFPF